jgi:hypothetical protein
MNEEYEKSLSFCLRNYYTNKSGVLKYSNGNPISRR